MLFAGKVLPTIATFFLLTLDQCGAAYLVKRARSRALLDLNLPPPDESQVTPGQRYVHIKDLPEDLQRRYKTARDSQSRRRRLQRIRQAPPDEPVQLARGTSTLSNKEYLDREKERQVRKNRAYYSDPKIRQRYNEYSKNWYRANKGQVLAKQRQETQLIQTKRKAEQPENTMSNKRVKSLLTEEARSDHLAAIREKYRTDMPYREAKRQYQRDYQRKRKAMLKEIETNKAGDANHQATIGSNVQLTRRSLAFERRADSDKGGQRLEFDLNKSPPAASSPSTPSSSPPPYIRMPKRRRRPTLSGAAKQNKIDVDRRSRQAFLKRVRESDPKAPVEYSTPRSGRKQLTNEQLLERKRLQNIESQHRQRKDPERRKAINERSRKYYASHQARMRELDHQRYLRRRESVLAKYRQKKGKSDDAADAARAESGSETENAP